LTNGATIEKSGIDETLKKVLVIGSGPIIIGQAAEFDYAGTQACRSLREEGVEVVVDIVDAKNEGTRIGRFFFGECER